MRDVQLLPDGAWDCHSHIYPQDTAKFPVAPGKDFESGASLADYDRVSGQLGINRSVFVQGKAYPDDMSTLNAVAEAGPERARALLFLPSKPSEADLIRWQDAGVRGFRFLYQPGQSVDMDEVRRGAALAAPRNWHVIVQAESDALAQVYRALLDLPCPAVIDHLGRLPRTDNRSALASLLHFASAGGWIKLAAPYNVTADGQSHFSSIAPAIRDMLEAAPTRTIWGLNFPHPNLPAGRKPDERSTLLSLLALLTLEERRAVFVGNPSRLYA